LPMSSITMENPPSQEVVRNILESEGFHFEPAQYAFWMARGTGCTAVYYKSGKLVLQGKACKDTAGLVGWHSGHGNGFRSAIAMHPAGVSSWIGMDESGKGDYFGPLVAAAVRVESKDIAWLEELGVKDSKKLSDDKALRLGRVLSQVLPFNVVYIGPGKYNSMYDSMGNLNAILAWAHAKALAGLLKKVDADLALLDKFCAKDRMEKALNGIKRKIRFEQRPRAEDDPAVAAASVVARMRFNTGLMSMGKKLRMVLPKGAGTPVVIAARKLVEIHGPGVLASVAKLHFRNTGMVLQKERHTESRHVENR